MTFLTDQDTYHTPDGLPRQLRETLLLGTRWAPYSNLLNVILKYRPLALRGQYNREAWAESSVELVHRLEGCAARFEIEGLDTVRQLSGPAVFVANHMGSLETFVLPGLVAPFRPVTFVAKKQLVEGWFWGPIMRACSPILVGRTDPRADLETVLTQGSAALAAGTSIIVFPQGTRKDVFVRQELNSLGAKLAAKAGVPIVPVALKTDYWGNSRVLKGFGPCRRDRTIHFRFGTPIPVEGRGKTEHEQVLDFLEGSLRDWGARLE